MKFSQIVEALGDEVTSSSLGTNATADVEVKGLAAIQEANATQLSYVEGTKFASYLATTQAGALVIPSDEALQAKATERNIAWVSVKNPRLDIARAITCI